MTAYLESMGTAVSFIDTHLEDPINLHDIAAAVSYSLFHFCRIFNQTVHHSPHDYLIRRRLTEAARRLVAGEERITDLAFATNSAARRPSPAPFDACSASCRRRGANRECAIPGFDAPLTRAHLKQRRGLPAPRLVEMPALTLVGLMHDCFGRDGRVPFPRRCFRSRPRIGLSIIRRGGTRHGRPLFVGTVGKQPRLHSSCSNCRQ
jgi:hypothetical protein